MRKNYFDLKLSQFSKYLNEIGILSEIDKEQFQKQFYEISSDIYNSKDISSNDYNVNYIYFKETASNALVYFIKSLTEEKQKFIALNIFMKFSIKEDLITEKLLKIIKIISSKWLKKYFHIWKSNIFKLTSELKRTISSHIISNISNLKNQFEQKYNISMNDNKENNLTNENTIDTNNNYNCYRSNLKPNNSMANLNSQMLNISTTPDVYNNNNNCNNNSCYENSAADKIINIYTNDRKHKIINIGELNNTYSTNYYRPNNLFNNSNCNNNYNNNIIQNYMNRTNYNRKYKYPGRYTINNSYLNNNYNLSTSKSKELNVSKIKQKVNIDYLNNLSKSKTEHNLIPERTTQYLKEQEELNNHCTFKPKINKSSSFSSYNNLSNKKSIDRLYLDSKNRIARKELQSLKKSNLESKQNTFQPKFVSSSVKKIKSDFEQRLKEFENNKKKKLKKISAELEKDQKQQYTFSPKINESFNNNNNNSKSTSKNQSTISKRKKIPAYKRLYNENKFKKIRQEERVKEEMDKIRKNSSKISEGSVLDTRKIEELYNDYKIKKSRLKIKQDQIAKEQGITFKPELISEKKYYDKINPDFYEREKEFLEKQQQNIETYKLFLQKEENNKKKKYSEEEKKEICSNIVTRLYKDGVEKYKQKRNNISELNDINYNNNGDGINENIIIKNKNNKNISGISNNKSNFSNDFQFEQEPEEEVFKSNFRGINSDYLTISEDKNYDINQKHMDFTKS